MNKKLLQTFSALEVLLLFTLGILSNKISEILQINHTFLWIATIVIILALLAISIYRNPPSESKRAKLNLQVSKKTVRNTLIGILYYPSALLLSKGAFAYSRAVDDNWLGLLSGGAVSGVLIFTFLLLDNAREEGRSILPLTIGLLLSLIYGVIGLYIDLFPEFFNLNIFPLAMISSVTFVGLKYVFLYYTFIPWFEKWYTHLPDS